MARMKFYCDAERCIECNACVTACKNQHEVPWGINRRRVVTINDGDPGERSVSVACMHCSDAPCMAVCPVDCFYQTADGVVLHSKDLVNWRIVNRLGARSKMISKIAFGDTVDETDLERLFKFRGWFSFLKCHKKSPFLFYSG